MEEIEAPIEPIFEEIHHQAHEAKENWFSQVALSSALLAVLAAIAALISNHHSNEAMIEQIQSSDHWSHYQAKSIKATMLQTKLELLTSLKKRTSKKDHEKLSEYKAEQAEISERAQEKEASSETHLRHHVVLARGVTLFQVAIAVAAISVLTRRRRFWYTSLGFGVVGLAFMVQGLFLIR